MLRKEKRRERTLWRLDCGIKWKGKVESWKQTGRSGAVEEGRYK